MANPSASQYLKILNIHHVSIACYIGLKSLNGVDNELDKCMFPQNL